MDQSQKRKAKQGGPGGPKGSNEFIDLSDKVPDIAAAAGHAEGALKQIEKTLKENALKQEVKKAPKEENSCCLELKNCCM